MHCLTVSLIFCYRWCPCEKSVSWNSDGEVLTGETGGLSELTVIIKLELPVTTYTSLVDSGTSTSHCIMSWAGTHNEDRNSRLRQYKI